MKTVPYNKFVVVTPSDTVDFVRVPHAIYVGVAGDVTVVNGDNTTVLFKALPVGIHAIGGFKRINATATTATNILALYVN